MCLILTLLKFGAFVAIWDKPRHIDQSNKKVTKSHGTFCIATYIYLSKLNLDRNVESVEAIILIGGILVE